MIGRPRPFASERRPAQLKQRICKTIAGLAVAGWTLMMASGLSTAAVHVVQPGDTLTHIAKQYGKTVEQLMALNDIRDPNQIRIGEKISVSGQPVTYVVQPGDTLSVIARNHGMTTQQLAQLNGLRNIHRILPGEELIVSARTIQHRVSRGETVSAIAARYGVTIQSLVEVNGLRNPDRLRVGQTLLIPPTGGGAVEAAVSGRFGATSRIFNRWPVQGVISSKFGMRSGRPHEGLDIAAPHGTPIYAVAAGRVIYSDAAGSYGLLIKIDHGNGIETRYAHASRLIAKPGETVKEGQLIARVGSTGRSTGPHLHFEVRVNGEAVDPTGWLP